MVFKELEIQGFKSFPDKVKITFDEGVTGVVGPNGSGKSNLSDAVRWVLGETSARQLRAAGKMEDVIFGGTRRRGAMGFAQVRLTLDNSSHALDVEADEVTIGRRYYRSGESEYSINGQICRLKDVYELLLDTGIGRGGYSVIGQGRIAEIVAAKSSERREIFEEACGIAKYRYRKNEAERRLAAAAENLERLRDILGELEARVGPLEKESEKARKFLELSARRKTLEVTLWTDGVHRAKEAVRRQVRDYETAQADYERFDRQTKAAESEAEEIRMQAQQLTIAVERLNGDIRSITEQISGSESRIAVLENVMNPTNIGAIFRSAAALGMDAVLLTAAGSDPLYRRSSRVSMGNVFLVPWTYLPEDADWTALLHQYGFKTAAMALRADSIRLNDARLAAEPKLAVVMGTEGDGLAADTIAHCDYTVMIPMSHGVDSLNVAAASAVAFYQLGLMSRPDSD